MGTSESKVNGKPLNIVGKPFRKVDARAKCTGETKFADDIFLPRMLYCKILRSHEPHALIKKIDVARALEVPGVLAIITGKDLPIPYGILPVSQDEHALCVDLVRFVGDPVAAVIARDEATAFEALARIDTRRRQTPRTVSSRPPAREPAAPEPAPKASPPRAGSRTPLPAEMCVASRSPQLLNYPITQLPNYPIT